jgi:hypothetical protein
VFHSRRTASGPRWLPTGRRISAGGQHDAKLILDHLEGFDPGDVTAQHYNTDPQIVKKRATMAAWVGWLERQAEAAIAADATLLDREAIAEQVYRIRYGDEAWKKAVERKKR